MIKLKTKDSDLFMIIDNYIFFLNDIKNKKVEIITSNNFSIKFNYIDYSYDDFHNFTIQSLIDVVIVQIPVVYLQTKQNLVQV
ncbi:MAG: hypothetical protein RMJ67_05975 [Elusimicrobiota bacterium]|nr:hypothetical protein [Endomicrobiia bacterium]MDW8166040.1 hypothetical protein [Elusimicrobiota bacterium]